MIQTITGMKRFTGMSSSSESFGEIFFFRKESFPKILKKRRKKSSV